MYDPRRRSDREDRDDNGSRGPIGANGVHDRRHEQSDRSADAGGDEEIFRQQREHRTFGAGRRERHDECHDRSEERGEGGEEPSDGRGDRPAIFLGTDRRLRDGCAA